MSNIIQVTDTPARMEEMIIHVNPATYKIYPPYISARRPKIRSVDVTTRDRAVDGQMAEAAGMCNSSTRVGSSTLEPEM